MHVVPTVFAFFSISLLAIASPTPTSQQDAAQAGQVDAFSISQVPVHQDRRKSLRKIGVIAYKNALAKYNAKIPSHVVDAAAAATSGIDPNTPEAEDQEYLSPVQIGTPAQTLMMDFDTGSSDLFCFSSELSPQENAGHSIYNPGSSSTSSQKEGQTWNITYGDGSGAAGNVFGDKVVVGGVTATSQAVEAATAISMTFAADTQNDGLFGLGFSSINQVRPTKQTTFFDTVKPTLKQPVFAAYLRHNAPGVYDFGFIDNTKYSGRIGYAPVSTENGFWEFNAGAYSVGGAAGGRLGDSIADTGTSIVLVPADVAIDYYGQVEEAEYNYEIGGFIFPCEATLPDFTVDVGGVRLNTPGRYINYAVVDDGICFGGLQYNMGLPFSILGDVFLKSQYAVFDGGATRIGFAPQK